jgi:hypothetical protein
LEQRGDGGQPLVVVPLQHLYSVSHLGHRPISSISDVLGYRLHIRRLVGGRSQYRQAPYFDLFGASLSGLDNGVALDELLALLASDGQGTIGLFLG